MAQEFQKIIKEIENEIKKAEKEVLTYRGKLTALYYRKINARWSMLSPSDVAQLETEINRRKKDLSDACETMEKLQKERSYFAYLKSESEGYK